MTEPFPEATVSLSGVVETEARLQQERRRDEDRRVVWGLVLGRGDRSRFGSLSQEAQQWTRRGQWPKAGQEEGNPGMLAQRAAGMGSRLECVAGG